MDIFPAIDLKDGQVVRLTQGDYGKVEVYGHDPAAAARRFAGQGARFLHVVDLDGAKAVSYTHLDAGGRPCGRRRGDGRAHWAALL